MKLHVVELLKKNGKPYKKPSFFGCTHSYKDVAQSIIDRCVECKFWTRGRQRIRTLALLPFGEE